ncbi:unnamed protein product [Protopolystoma xenopodis]|uniref:Uncharacterized protein n=1 Tax=Protopolystoma xenopodis TaxID=117903 RepID=A0A3S5CE54_9PLAT|nr:unnamed protein product [Protopolystoma xenopodis]
MSFWILLSPPFFLCHKTTTSLLESVVRCSIPIEQQPHCIEPQERRPSDTQTPVLSLSQLTTSRSSPSPPPVILEVKTGGAEFAPKIEEPGAKNISGITESQIPVKSKCTDSQAIGADSRIQHQADSLLLGDSTAFCQIESRQRLINGPGRDAEAS